MARRLRRQAVWSRATSPLYADILERAAADVEAAGPCWEILEPQRASSAGADDALPLRLLSAVHRLALEGSAPMLARHYPSCGGEPGPALWSVFVSTVAAHRDTLIETIRRPVQTNDVGRSAALLGGFLTIARETGLPLRLLEAGASAGLNLRWDRYRYEIAGQTWGDPDSPVRIGTAFTGALPPLDAPVEISERRGCDLVPLDPSSAADRLTLRSSIPPDETERMELLTTALRAASETPVPVECADGADWIAEQLAARPAGMTTVLFHTIVLQYLDENRRARFLATVEAAGRQATEASPLAWLRMEPAFGRVRIDLTVWPGGVERELGTATNRGHQIQWEPA